AVALLVGMVLGAYSLIYIAAPVLAMLKEREPRHRAVRERIERGQTTDSVAASVAADADELVGADTTSARPATPKPSSAAKPAGIATVSRPVPGGAIPPRPRKKKRR